MSPRRVTILSDFGTADGYAAAMAGVIAAAAPSAPIDHASHSIPPGDIITAALTLSRYAFLYPPETVHLVVVDPGVGTDRRAIAAAIDGRFFVAPDNGVLTRVLQQAADPVIADPVIADPTVVMLDPAAMGTGDAMSATFHGRDLFAPAAGLLARGEPLDALGSRVADPVRLDLPKAMRTDRGIAGEVIQVDRYGNLITNIPADWLGDGLSVRVDDRSAGPVRRTYGDVASGEIVALVGSLDLLEVSVRDGRAADRLGAQRGSRVVVEPGRSALEPLPVRGTEPALARRQETQDQVSHQDDGPHGEEQELDEPDGEPEHGAHHGQGDGDAHDGDQPDDEEGQ